MPRQGRRDDNLTCNHQDAQVAGPNPRLPAEKATMGAGLVYAKFTRWGKNDVVLSARAPTPGRRGGLDCFSAIRRFAKTNLTTPMLVVTGERASGEFWSPSAV
jgi:hypothetical protein